MCQPTSEPRKKIREERRERNEDKRRRKKRRKKKDYKKIKEELWQQSRNTPENDVEQHTESSRPAEDLSVTGNDSTVIEAAKGDLESNYENIWRAEKCGEGYFMRLSIWCASTIFSLCAGCFGPMVTAFGICAVAESWRIANVTQVPDKMFVGTDIKDPRW